MVFKHLYGNFNRMNCSEVLPVCKAYEEKQVLKRAKEKERLPHRIEKQTEGESARKRLIEPGI